MHILLIEPDAVLARTYQSALQTEGHSVAHATSAQHAIIAADEQTPDLVILELQLPSHNGIAFLQEFQSYSDWADVPVVFHTYVPVRTNGDAHKIMRHEYGVEHWLYKPQTTLAQLLATVGTYDKPGRVE
jgi:two-component system phosphate regulon response regulator PhoB